MTASPASRDPAAEWVALAQGWFDRGRLTTADLALRQMFDAGVERADAWNLLGRIAQRVGEPALAAECFRRALRIDPHFTAATENLGQAERDRASAGAPGTDAWRRERPAAGERAGFLVVRAWGAGFWSDVDHVLGSLLLAEITGRVPIVSWWGGSRWAPEGCESAWDLYFEPVSIATLDDAFRAGSRVFPARWSRNRLAAATPNKWTDPDARIAGVSLLNRPEEVVVADFYNSAALLRHWLPEAHPLRGAATGAVYRALAGRLRLVADVQREIDAFWNERIGPGPVAALHLRGTDKFREVPDLEGGNAECLARAHGLLDGDPSMRLFLLTDSIRAVGELRRRYGGRLIATDCQRADGTLGVHLLRGLPVDRRRLGIEVIRDTFLASRCDRFVGLGASNVACMVEHLRDWPAGACVLLGPHVHERPPLGIHAD